MSDEAPATSSEATVPPPDLVAGLRRELAEVAGERDRYKQLAELMQKELERLRDGQKTPREHVDSAVAQLAFEQMAQSLLSSQPAPAPPPPSAPPDRPEPRKRTPHGRSILPEHLPVQTLVLALEGAAAEGTVIGEEVSWKLAFKRGGFYRLKIVRPVFVLPRVLAAAADPCAVVATQHDGDYSPMAEAVKTVEPAALVAAIEAAAEIEAGGPVASCSSAPQRSSRSQSSHPSLTRH